MSGGAGPGARARRVVVVGAGMGGLAAAIDLARAGLEVTVLEAQAAPGGKARAVPVAGRAVDGGPTVFTMRWIFESLFADAGASLDGALQLEPAQILARHAWTTGGTLDLFADVQRSADAIGAFAGAADARGYLAFCARSRDIYRTLRDTFIAAQRPSPFELVRRVGFANLGAMWRTAPLSTLWRELGRHFRDPRLRQLFGRYATYVGSSPLEAPATLMLIAHVEQDGVWRVAGGMHAVARAMQALAERHGARFRFGARVERIVVERGRACGVQLADGERLEADAVVFNGDTAALSAGLLGDPVRGAARAPTRAQRSLSAVTWCLLARARGLPLHHHNVFFGAEYLPEFEAVFRRRTIVDDPTVYVCAQDRGDACTAAQDTERLLVLINAPADGDRGELDAATLDALASRTFGLMRRCGVDLAWDEDAAVCTTPAGFERLFPASGGALYGRANHGSFASFARPGAASRVPGLYLAGGSVHPGAGVPMATMSGRLAAARVLRDAEAPR